MKKYQTKASCFQFFKNIAQGKATDMVSKNFDPTRNPADIAAKGLGKSDVDKVIVF